MYSDYKRVLCMVCVAGVGTITIVSGIEEILIIKQFLFAYGKN